MSRFVEREWFIIGLDDEGFHVFFTKHAEVEDYPAWIQKAVEDYRRATDKLSGLLRQYVEVET